MVQNATHKFPCEKKGSLSPFWYSALISIVPTTVSDGKVSCSVELDARGKKTKVPVSEIIGIELKDRYLDITVVTGDFVPWHKRERVSSEDDRSRTYHVWFKEKEDAERATARLLRHRSSATPGVVVLD